MRCLNMVERAMVDPRAISAESVIAKLRRAQTGLRDMATLLDRTMHDGQSGMKSSAIFAANLPLIEQVQCCMNSVRTLAEQHQVQVCVQVNPAAARLNGGALGTVMVNGMRNAIEACASIRGREQARSVGFSASVTMRNELIILISDTGPGVPAALAPGQTTKRHGHGIGLELCRSIVSDLGGRLELVNIPPDRGAVLRIIVPVARLGGA